MVDRVSSKFLSWSWNVNLDAIDRGVIPVLIGATGIGKTKLALSLLEFNPRLRFVMCDSRKVYRYLDIGTAKPAKDKREYFSMLDLVDPNQTYNAQFYREDAEREIIRLLNSGFYPLIIAGTPFYLWALFHGLSPLPKVNYETRETLRLRIKNEGPQKLYQKLLSVDPETAENIHVNDAVRIARALEVYYDTGIPISKWRKTPHPEPLLRPYYLGIKRERHLIYTRIEERCIRMVKSGLLEETKDLLKRGYQEDLPALNTLGYREMIAHLKGEVSFDDALKLMIKRTKIFARKQVNFFKRLNPDHWFSLDDPKTRGVIEEELKKIGHFIQVR